MAILVIADHADGELSETTFRTVQAASRIGDQIDILVAGSNCAAVAEEAAKVSGVVSVWVADNARYEHQSAEAMAPLIVELGQSYDVIVASTSSVAKDIMPRVAALLDVMQVSEIIEVVDPNTFRRPIYAGNAIETVQVLDERSVITVRTSTFDPVPSDGNGEVKTAPDVEGAEGSTFIRTERSKSDRPDLGGARIVVSGGQAFGSREQFEKVLFPLADKLNAAIGASRAAVDAGFVSNDSQVGQSGKVIAPQLYIACGISGAIQHVAGMKDSKVIVAINKDAEAPIFKIADYGLVADVFEAIPELTGKL